MFDPPSFILRSKICWSLCVGVNGAGTWTCEVVCFFWILNVSRVIIIPAACLSPPCSSFSPGSTTNSQSTTQLHGSVFCRLQLSPASRTLEDTTTPRPAFSHTYQIRKQVRIHLPSHKETFCIINHFSWTGCDSLPQQFCPY